jgi:hypothetical protein
VLYCVGRAIATGRPLVQGVLTTVEKTVPKPHIMRRSGFSENCRATGKGKGCPCDTNNPVVKFVNAKLAEINVALFVTIIYQWSIHNATCSRNSSVSPVSCRFLCVHNLSRIQDILCDSDTFGSCRSTCRSTCRSVKKDCMQ